MATRLLHLMPRLRKVLLGNGRQASFNRVWDIPGKRVFRDPIDNVTRRREHPGEAMLGPLGSIPG